MSSSTVSSWASSTSSSAYFTAWITLPPISKSSDHSREYLVKYLLYNLYRIHEKEHPFLPALPLFTLLISSFFQSYFTVWSCTVFRSIFFRAWRCQCHLYLHWFGPVFMIRVVLSVYETHSQIFVCKVIYVKYMHLFQNYTCDNQEPPIYFVPPVCYVSTFASL